MTMNKYLASLTIAIFLLLTILSGCIENDDDDDEDTPSSIPAPVWNPGKYWVYTFTTQDEMDLVNRMVVAQDDGENHLVGTADENHARLHGVLNYNPLLGRVRLNDYAVYEKGEPQPLFMFPLTKTSSWSFAFLDVDLWEARVASIESADIPGRGDTVLVNIHAESPEGDLMDYSFDTAAGWVYMMRASKADGEVIVNMTLVSHGSGHTGQVFFVRGRDLYDGDFSSPPPVVEAHDTFLDSGHPSYGDFDRLIIYLNVISGGGSAGSLSLRDHESNLGWHFIVNEDSNGNHITDIPDESGNWTLEVNLEGNTYVRIRVAGGIWYTWDV